MGRTSPYVFRVKNLGLALATAGLVLAASTPELMAADDSKTVGRVRVTTLSDTRDLHSQRVERALATRFRRVISVRPHPGEPKRFEATVYDYSVETAFELVLDAVRTGSIVRLDDSIASRWGPRLVNLVRAVGTALLRLGGQ